MKAQARLGSRLVRAARYADGRYRIDAAKTVLQGIVAGLPEDDRLHVGLRVYGGRLFAADEGAETIGPPKRRYVTGDGRVAQRFPVTVR